MSNVGVKLGGRMFRTLYADEIDVRVGMQRPAGVSLLLYKDARCDQSILDETVGPMNWMRSHSRDNANCVVSIWDDKKAQWISKEDTGTESNTEAAKGLASDSFKRACVSWGIGRELYTSPFVWIQSSKLEFEKDGKHIKTKFAVSEIDYDDQGNISALTIIDATKGTVLYTHKGARKPTERVGSIPDDSPAVQAASAEKAPTAPANSTTVTKADKMPEWNFGAEISQICAELDCDMTAFATMRKACISAGACPDIPSNKLTVEDQKQLIHAIRLNFCAGAANG